MQITNVILDLRPRPEREDYLVLEWQHHDKEGNIVTSGQKYISDDDLREDIVTQYEIVFVPDPISAKDLTIQIKGRFQERSLSPFAHTYELSDKAVLIRARRLESGEGYKLVSI